MKEKIKTSEHKIFYLKWIFFFYIQTFNFIVLFQICKWFTVQIYYCSTIIFVSFKILRKIFFTVVIEKLFFANYLVFAHSLSLVMVSQCKNFITKLYIWCAWFTWNVNGFELCTKQKDFCLLWRPNFYAGDIIHE